jgi:hypothetical protein
MAGPIHPPGDGPASFQGPLHPFIDLGFHATLWAPDIIPLSPDRYFFKHSMLLAHKLINRHYILLSKNYPTYLLLPLFITR